MRAVIFLGTPDFSKEKFEGFVKKDDFVICADRGYVYAKALNVVPNVVLGDFDSSDIAEVDNENILVYPAEKDYTDCEIAVDYAIENGAEEIVLICALGGRIDHTLGNIYAIARGINKKVRTYIYDGETKIYVCDEFFETTGEIGDILSVFPFPDARCFTTKNLKYSLENQDLPYTGVSNVFEKNYVSLKFSGRAIVVHIGNF